MYTASDNRYGAMPYNRLGNSGLKLSAASLGLWHNYGPPEGTAELNFGRILREDLLPYRDEIVISTRAGYWMWPGPYGDWGSRKYLLSSLDQSLKRLGLEYVDIFYHHRPDPETPLEETMGALATAVQSGKALYAGLSNYTESGWRRPPRSWERASSPSLPWPRAC